MSSTKVRLGEVQVASTSFLASPTLEQSGGGVTLRYVFDRDGVDCRSGIHFAKVRAYRWRAESYCTGWHVEDAYDTVAEVEDSEWIAELLEAEPEYRRGDWTMRHFMIFLDGYGCLETVAESWTILPEEGIQ